MSVKGHLILIGFMGSGKSTIARKLAGRLKMKAIDMDASIARDAGMSVKEIFEQEGEEGFRVREQAFLESMALCKPCILSCGGGIVTRTKARGLLKQLGTVVYLEVSADEAISRISHPETRPLLHGSIPPSQLLEQRRPLYEEAADIIFSTNGLTINQVTIQLEDLLIERGIL